MSVKVQIIAIANAKGRYAFPIPGQEDSVVFLDRVNSEYVVGKRVGNEYVNTHYFTLEQVDEAYQCFDNARISACHNLGE